MIETDYAVECEGLINSYFKFDRRKQSIKARKSSIKTQPEAGSIKNQYESKSKGMKAKMILKFELTIPSFQSKEDPKNSPLNLKSVVRSSISINNVLLD